MAGHSQFKNIQHRKGAQDAKRSNVFAKLSRKITVIARDGVDPLMNSKLKAAIEEARCMNMPRDKIEAAIKKGDKTISSEIDEYAVYEARFGDIALMIEVLTENKNRTGGAIKKILRDSKDFNDFGGAAFLFVNRGVVIYDRSSLNIPAEIFFDDILLLDFVEDVIDEEFVVGSFSSVANLAKMRSFLFDKYGLPICSRNVWIPHEYISTTDDKRQKIDNVIQSLEDMDDVVSVDTNIFLNLF